MTVENDGQADNVNDDAEAKALWDQLDKAEADAAGSPPEGRDSASADETFHDEPSPQADPAAAAAGAESEPDPWASAPPKLRELYQAEQQRLAALEHSERSQRGRISALSRQLDELKRTTTAPPKEAPRPITLDDNPGFKKLVEEYPEIAEPLRDVIKPVIDETVATKKALNERSARDADDERRRVYDANLAAFSAANPDFQELWKQQGIPDEFAAWVATQPRHIREAAERNGQNIEDPEEAADVFARFKQSKGIGAGSRAEPDPLTTRRMLQQESGAAPTIRSAPSLAGGIPDDADPEVIWKMFDQLEAKGR